MSNLESQPIQRVCTSGGEPDTQRATEKLTAERHTTEGQTTKGRTTSTSDTYADVEIITHREVPLGGPRAMPVRRTLPQKKRSLIGAWCFADHYGPSDVSSTGGMDVAPHPHTGLQTVSWLFEGKIEHIDSGDNRGMVLPGEVNLMTSGAGICHSETSPSDVTTLHGVQLWVALPNSVRSTAPRALDHYAPTPCPLEGGSALVFIGSLAGATSPIETHTPLLGAELTVDPHSTITLDVDPDFEHGLLVDEGNIVLENTPIPVSAIGYTGIGATRLRIRNESDSPARLVLLGGEPFPEDIVMWWNFVGRSSEEITEFRDQWQARTERFGDVKDYVGHGGPGKNADGLSWLPAPKLPNGVIKPRTNPEPHARANLPEPGERTETVTTKESR
ncbi:pirin family protein [Corynebacterium sp. 320]|uniref:pirin family protein n=1 Tax=Corynebacterium TaxID=1716 RepID=UPI00125CBC2F|nr:MULTISPECIES: pirin family protein [Corynebacterium]KAB1504470.1 pirin family protein [Corynebacterium sp. 320]KAB3528606.1 pirin family protein [Corynebacterium sp. 250]QNP92151.1 pirin family protein [Corynebacterium zhongnanshanii]